MKTDFTRPNRPPVSVRRAHRNRRRTAPFRNADGASSILRHLTAGAAHPHHRRADGRRKSRRGPSAGRARRRSFDLAGAALRADPVVVRQTLHRRHRRRPRGEAAARRVPSVRRLMRRRARSRSAVLPTSRPPRTRPRTPTCNSKASGPAASARRAMPGSSTPTRWRRKCQRANRPSRSSIKWCRAAARRAHRRSGRS